MSKFTKGPWKVGYESFTVDAGSMRICDIRGWGHLTGKGSLGLPFDQAKAIQEANARLIAAAPDMFEMLVSLHSEECAKDSFPGRSCELCVLLEKITTAPTATQATSSEER